MSSAPELEQVRQRAEKATEAPWFVHDFADPAVSSNPSPADVTVSCDHPATITVCYMGRALTATLEEARANAAFIAHARQDIPRLLATLAERDAELARRLNEIAAYNEENRNLNAQLTASHNAALELAVGTLVEHSQEEFDLLTAVRRIRALMTKE